MSILGQAVRNKDVNKAPVRMWLYGPPDSGKTHFAVQFPKPLLLSTDGNYVYERVPANSLDAWEVGPLAKPEVKAKAFVNLLQELKTTDAYETVILDLIDGVQRLVRGHFLKVLNIVHESDLNYGKAYQTVNENFIAQIEQLFKLPLNIIIISHQDREVIKPKNGAEYTIFKPKLDDKYHDTIEGYCNLVSRVYLDVNDKGQPVRKLTLTIKDNEYGINRLGQVEDLILTHNADNYTDFMAVWQELYNKRGLGLTTLEVNTTRKKLEQSKENSKKNELIDKAKRVEATALKAKADSAEKVEVTKEVMVADEVAVTTEIKVDSDSTNPDVAAKIARIKAAKDQFKKETVTEAPKVIAAVEKTMDTPDGIDDGEPPVIKTDAVKDKLARIKAIREAALAAEAAKK